MPIVASVNSWSRLLSSQDGLSKPTFSLSGCSTLSPHLQTSSLLPVPSVVENGLDSCFIEATRQELLNSVPFYYSLPLPAHFLNPYCRLVIFLLFLLNFVTRLLQGIVPACSPICSLAFIKLNKVKLLTPMRQCSVFT